jgi:Flp pilus assembly pilin Flp
MFTLLSAGKLELVTNDGCAPATLHLGEGIRLMLKYYVKASDVLARLREDKDGVVSFEYVIVAACIVAAVAAAFGTGTASGIGLILSNAVTAIGTAVTAAVAA